MLDERKLDEMPVGPAQPRGVFHGACKPWQEFVKLATTRSMYVDSTVGLVLSNLQTLSHGGLA